MASNDPAHQALTSTSGYAEQAAALLEKYESYDPAVVMGWVLPYLQPASQVVDVGAGTGRDAAWLVGLGHRVVAVEPVAEMRAGAMRLHPEPEIEWVDDGLPALSSLEGRGFDAVMASAVWMHLDAAEREASMARVRALVRRGGFVGITLRHGPIPAGRRMFDVSLEETVALAREHGFTPVVEAVGDGARSKQAGVHWSRVGLVRD